MDEQEFRQRAALAVLPDCIRLATESPVTFNVKTGSRVITDETMHNIANMAAKIAEYLTAELDKDGNKKEQDEEYKKMRELLSTPVRRLNFEYNDARIKNCLRSSAINTVAELVQWHEEDLRKIRDFGNKSLNSVKETVEGLGLYLGMDVSEYK